jgi:hypothetical protein
MSIIKIFLSVQSFYSVQKYIFASFNNFLLFIDFRGILNCVTFAVDPINIIIMHAD